MSSNLQTVKLKEIMEQIERPEIPIPGKIYRQLGVKLWGEGAYERESIDGSQTKYKTLSRVQEKDIVVNKIWARNGSVSVVPEILSGCFVSGEFPTFYPIQNILEPRWFHWLTKTKGFWKQCDEKSQGTSGKNRIRPEKFLEIEIPIPSVPEQRRIVARIEELAARIDEARELRIQIEKDLNNMLLGAYRSITKEVQFLPMSIVAPLKRRPIEIEIAKTYYELGIRSFGKGAFHKPPISGASLGTKRIFRIENGDLLFNIVFAWEGAIAVARPEDRGRVGSHRFLTCDLQEDFAVSQFLCFHFLTDKGLRDLGEASPGGAGRNRTLGIKALEKIMVPVPPIEKQLWFKSLQANLAALKRHQAQTAAELDALLPALLERAFRGEL